MTTPAMFGGDNGNELLPPEGMDDIQVQALNVKAGLDVTNGLNTDTLTVGGVTITPPEPDPTVAKFGGEGGNELLSPNPSPDGDIKIRRLNVTEGLDVVGDALIDKLVLAGRRIIIGENGTLRVEE